MKKPVEPIGDEHKWQLSELVKDAIEGLAINKDEALMVINNGDEFQKRFIALIVDMSNTQQIK